VFLVVDVIDAMAVTVDGKCLHIRD